MLEITKIRKLALQIAYASEVGAPIDAGHADELANRVLDAFAHFTCATGIIIPDPDGDIDRFTHDPDVALLRQHRECLTCGIEYSDIESPFSAKVESNAQYGYIGGRAD